MFERTFRTADKMLYGQQIELNELLKVRFEGSNSISLHITPVIDRKKEVSSSEEKNTGSRKRTGETARLWNDALTKLAKLVTEEPRFIKVTTITFTSWLARTSHYGEILKEKGFHVDADNADPDGNFLRVRNKVRNVVMRDVPKEHQGLEPCFATMTREKLLQTYGS